MLLLEFFWTYYNDLVIGLLRGLGKRLKVATEAKQLASKDDEGNSSTFHVSWS